MSSYLKGMTSKKYHFLAIDLPSIENFTLNFRRLMS